MSTLFSQSVMIASYGPHQRLPLMLTMFLITLVLVWGASSVAFVVAMGGARVSKTIRRFVDGDA